MAKDDRWREYGSPPVRTLLITIQETVKGLNTQLGNLSQEAADCDLSHRLHLDNVAHVDRPKAYKDVTKATELLLKAREKIRESIRVLGHP